MATPDDQQDPALTAGADQRPHGNLSHADLAEALVAALTQELRSVLGPRRWAVADGVHYLMGVGGLERATAEELVRHGTGRTWIVEDGQLVLPPVLFKFQPPAPPEAPRRHGIGTLDSEHWSVIVQARPATDLSDLGVERQRPVHKAPGGPSGRKIRPPFDTAVRELEGLDRPFVILARYGLDPREIASASKTDEGSVRSILERAGAVLEVKLRKRGFPSELGGGLRWEVAEVLSSLSLRHRVLCVLDAEGFSDRAIASFLGLKDHKDLPRQIADAHAAAKALLHKQITDDEEDLLPDDEGPS